jgi:hypothetical protein
MYGLYRLKINDLNGPVTRLVHKEDTGNTLVIRGENHT